MSLLTYYRVKVSLSFFSKQCFEQLISVRSCSNVCTQAVGMIASDWPVSRVVRSQLIQILLLFSGLLIFRAVAEPRLSSKSAKSRKIHKNTRNPAKFAGNLTKYMSAQHIWKLSWLSGLLTCCKLANLPWNFVTAASKRHPKTTRRS